jgi:two-component system, OmpR family, phosphate regulon sensor histidine kinase PhoR
MPDMSPLPKPFLILLCCDAAIWAALLTVIGVTVGGDPAWLAAIGIGGVGFTTGAAWYATRPRAAPAGEAPSEASVAAEPAPERNEDPAGEANDDQERHAESYQVLEAVPLAVLVVDRRRDILWANDRMRNLLGDAVAGRSLMGVLRHPPLIDALDQVMGGPTGEIANAPNTIEGVETPIGRDRLLIADLKRLDADRVLMALKDASAEHRLERLRSDFIANVSHELKTPIATLMGFIETLRGPAKGDLDAHERFLGIMHEQAGRMSRLVADLLSLSRIELNEHARPSGAVDLSEVIGRVANALSLRAAERHMKIELPGAPMGRAVGDPDELTQVFQNLIDNAIKYSRPGTAVTISATRIVDPVEIKAHLPGLRRAKAMIAIAVADRGEGIAREHIPRLTERFYRVDPARSRDLGGTGLGLAIVKHVVNRHRGSLEIESTPGEGSIFTVYLPAEEAAAGLRAAS